jgi:hypothetical protein
MHNQQTWVDSKEIHFVDVARSASERAKFINILVDGKGYLGNEVYHKMPFLCT